MRKAYIIGVLLLAVLLVLGACPGPVPETTDAETTPPTGPTTEPELTPAPDATPPLTVTGLVTNNAYDERVNLWWNKSTAGDFDHYNIYLNKAEMVDVTGITPIQQIKDIAICRYQVTGLEDGTRYYIAVTAVDKSGNEKTQVSSASATTAPMPRGTVDPDIFVDVYQSDMVWAGTTLLPDNHDPAKPRIIEVNMMGEIVWQYLLPDNLKQYTNPGFDVELLANNNILFVLPLNGVYEIDRSGKIVWSYLTNKVDHDADRLPNGNTIFVFGADDQKSDAQVTEVNPKGEIVWTWYAKDHFDKPPYKDIYDEGWTHTNAVTRLPNSNTLISLRNFNHVVEVDPQGSIVRTLGVGIVFDAQGSVVKRFGEGILFGVHDPESLPNGNILAISQNIPHRAVEIDSKTDRIVWEFPMPEPATWPVRDANRLPNGNTLITGSTKIVEVTAEGKIVWQLALKGITFAGPGAAARGFYKAERIGAQK